MAKKVILFLSELRPNVREKEYICPGGLRVTGGQTNEAPVKYLLAAYPDITQILCIVTPRAYATAWQRFSETVTAAAPGVTLRQIPFADGEDFSDGPLTEVMRQVQSGDEIFLETTGGFRNAIMHLLLLSRILSFRGIRTEKAVYSNFENSEIQDVSHLIGLFDLVGGMQEMTSFGNTRTLRAYFGRPAGNPAVEQLLASVEVLQEAIALCRTKDLADIMGEFDRALGNAEQCTDPLMQQLLPAFRQKFGSKGKKLTTPALIKWCIQSDMIQQALTVYTERIPAYIIHSGRHLLVGEQVRQPPAQSYEDRDAVQFTKDFLLLSKRYRLVERQDNSVRSYVETLENLEYLIKDSGYQVLCPIDQMHRICMDYLYIKMVRNMTNHANSEGVEDQTELMRYLESFGYESIDRISVKSVRTALLSGLDHLQTFSKKEKKK